MTNTTGVEQGRINHHKIQRQGCVAETEENLKVSIGLQREMQEMVAMDHHCHAHVEFAQTNPLK